MPMSQAPDRPSPGCDEVRLRRLLGVLVDAELTFAPLLKETRARAWVLFEEFFHAAESSGFFIPVAAAQVPLRLEPTLFLCVVGLRPGSAGCAKLFAILVGASIVGFPDLASRPLASRCRTMWLQSTPWDAAG